MRLLGATIAMLLSVSVALAPDQTMARSKSHSPANTPLSIDAQASAPDPSDTTGSLPNGSNNGSLAPRSSVTPPLAAAKPTLRDSYEAIPLADRIAVQSDLLWSGNYSGPVNGEFSDALVNAVKAFQRQNKTRQTGVLNPQERAALAELVRPQQEQVGWRLVYDAATGARLGLPGKFVPNASAGKTGSFWSSAQGQVRVETFRITKPDTTLADVFEQQKKEPAERRIDHQALRAESFALIGMQGLKKFHVRAYARNGEIRGITILYDQAMDGTMDPLMPVMAAAFQPFAGLIKAPQESAVTRRKVEYGTGLVVSSVGHIVTDLQVIDGCQVVIIPGVGRAERVANDTEANLALLRVYGAEDLVPLALVGEAPKGSDITLIGIADPQTQAGNSTITATNARLIHTASTSGTMTTLNQTPVIGFSGAAALDKNGRFYGMVALKIPVVAGTAPATPRATFVPADTIKNFIEANHVAPASGQPGVENCKASVVRVICVRK